MHNGSQDLDPFHRTNFQKVLIAILPKVTGGISFFSSSLIILMVLRSEIKPRTPFRRILFSMCIIDLMQSGISVISTASSPRDAPGIWGAMGNDRSCSITGFIFQFASMAAPLYMVSLICHYFFFVQYKVSERVFRRRIEPFLHAIPLGLSLLTAIILLLINHLNQADAICWIAPVPYNCINEPDIQCIRGEHSYMYRWIFAAIPNGVSLIVLNIISLKIYLIVKRQENEDANETANLAIEAQHEANDGASIETTKTNNRSEHIVRKINKRKIKRAGKIKKNNHSKKLSDKTEEGESGPSNLSLDANPSSLHHGNKTIMSSNSMKVDSMVDLASSNNLVVGNDTSVKINEIRAKKMLGLRKREALKQAFLFTGSFLICYIWVYLNGTYEVLGQESPYPIRICLWFFFPLQGVFNIMIFIRPHVNVLRQHVEDLSLMEAVWEVVKSGGDISREAIREAATKRKQQRERAIMKRRTAVVRSSMEVDADDRPVHVPPSKHESSVLSKPFTHIDGPDELVSSMGDFESFRDDLPVEDETDIDIVEFDDDLVMYGAYDYDIYGDDEGLSYDETDLHDRKDIFENDAISFDSDEEAQK